MSISYNGHNVRHFTTHEPYFLLNLNQPYASIFFCLGHYFPCILSYFIYLFLFVAEDRATTTNLEHFQTQNHEVSLSSVRQYITEINEPVAFLILSSVVKEIIHFHFATTN